MSDKAYPEGVTSMDHINHDMKMGRFPSQSSVATFLKERETLADQEKVGHLPSGPSEHDGESQLAALSAEATKGEWHHVNAFKTVPAESTIHGKVPAQRVDYVSTWPGLGTPPGHRTVVPMEGRESTMRSEDMAFVCALVNAYRSGKLKEIDPT